MTVTTPRINNNDIVTISYQDLVSFDRNNNASAEILMEEIGRAYGSNGLGILSVSGVPGFTDLRQKLLPLSARIPKLPDDDLAHCIDEESCYSVGWSHGKEELTPGVPDLSKGSFYANPLTNDLCQAIIDRRRKQNQNKERGAQLRDKEEKDDDDDDDDDDAVFEANLKMLAKENPGVFAPNVFPKSMPDLEAAIAEMGKCIARVGRLVAGVADAYCEKHGVSVKLEQILTDSLNCKARLLHYFDTTTTTTKNDDAQTPEPSSSSSVKEEEELWWCGWHNDHGSLTGLVPAMYMTDDGLTQLSSPPDPRAGLYIQSRRNKELVKINLPTDCIGFQIGETFQILSGGLLQATPHAVRRQQQTQTTTTNSNNNSNKITRETFAVFMEPEFDFPLTIPPNRSIEDVCPKNDAAINRSLKLNSIQSRWKPGMTFGAFHNVTVQTFHKQLDAVDEEHNNYS